jgi:hypothetical protein
MKGKTLFSFLFPETKISDKEITQAAKDYTKSIQKAYLLEQTRFIRLKSKINTDKIINEMVEGE